MTFSEQLAHYTAQVEDALDALLPPATARPTRLHEAMRYAVLGGGKRLRPTLCLAAAELFEPTKLRRGGDDTAPSETACAPAPPAAAFGAAVSIECLHCYSLVHDDLPCMDDDDLRRGRPTTHRAFDEATALLAGDALLTHAFALLAEHYADSPALAHALTRELAHAAGSRRLIGGQMEDLLAEKKQGTENAVTAETLDFIHLNKTAAMIEAALVMGGLVGGADGPQCETLRTVGRHLGLGFQIVDDILDATADTATLGKTAGKDARAEKTTYVSLYGIDAAQARAEEETQRALAALATLPGDTRFLADLTRSLTDRKK
ncbi:polyprenyl synthetase [Cephaloticoccus capnophilus]|uniref:Polyprenyl synthetase n=1 Tax=Cephaloticoccus capnophilus TaxID=1548208 RepID=A0A139SQ82_9BACT|nr:farnesyl diphosphate synthase [Cephaloticoccus capnophilus]KXU36749.1 polyprenyl synthetase [Cephaloticoccus capnophilus]